MMDLYGTRKAILAKRRALDAEEVCQLSAQAVERFHRYLRKLAPRFSWRGLNIGLYRAMSDELDLRSLEQELRDEGAQLFFPRVSRKGGRHMEFVWVPEGVEWEQGPYGIEEPHPELPAADLSLLDLLFVPGVAFGLSGERIGMGSGYYDRLLPLMPDALRVSLAFDFQLYPKLDQNSWDQSMDWIITDQREVCSPRALDWLARK